MSIRADVLCRDADLAAALALVREQHPRCTSPQFGVPKRMLPELAARLGVKEEDMMPDWYDGDAAWFYIRIVGSEL